MPPFLIASIPPQSPQGACPWNISAEADYSHVIAPNHSSSYDHLVFYLAANKISGLFL